MYIIEVIPLMRGTTAESLTYYASTAYEVGSLITVPVRKRTVNAVVVATKPVSKAKTALKAATFSLRKLSEQTTASQLPTDILATAELLTQQYPASLGAILFALLPPDVRSGVRDYPDTPHRLSESDATTALYTGTASERMLVYTSHIRQAFAHRGSVLLVGPTSAAVARLQAALSHGIEKRIVTFSSTATKKQINDAYQQFQDMSQAKLIITTPSFAFLERHDITHIIIEESGSSYYRARTKPYLDAREALKAYAAVTGRHLLLGDILPASEDEHKRRTETYLTHDEHPKRLQFNANITLAPHTKSGKETAWQLCTPKLQELVSLSLQNKGRVFFYAARRGLAPLVLCYDCGYVFRCPDSGAPYSLLRTEKDGDEKRWFICTTSGTRIPAADVCPQCNSWRLREQGVGIQAVEDEVKSLWPKSTILRLDHQTATTHNRAKRIMQEFYDTKNAILIGTSMALPYLHKSVDVSVVTSYEALRATPTWRTDAHTLSLLLNLRERTTKDCIVQTRDATTDSILQQATTGRIDAFYDEDISVRESLQYPPYAHFVLLTYSGEKTHMQELELNLAEQLVGYTMQHYQTPLPKPDTITRHTLLRVPDTDWPDMHLMDTLRALPPHIKIEVDPDRII